VTNPVPIPFRVDILVGDGESGKGNAVAFIYNAFQEWVPLIRELGILDADDPECNALRSRLFAEHA